MVGTTTSKARATKKGTRRIIILMLFDQVNEYVNDNEVAMVSRGSSSY